MSDKTESISAKMRCWADESVSDSRRYLFPTMNACKDLGIDDHMTGCTSERILFRRFADEIDKELSEAKEAYLGDEFARFAEVIGKPMLEDETIEDWLGRWYLPRPLFDDGEPAQFGDRFVNDKGNDSTLSSLNYTKGAHGYVSANGGQRHEVTNRLKRPKPQVLDADGVPIVVGDKVWLLPGKHCETFPLYGYKAGVEYTVSGNESAIHKGDGRICITGGDCTYGYPMPEQVTHREPDTQERIDRDAMKGKYEYWGCTGSECHNCPALVDGKKPNQRYGILWCGCAMRLDLLRRQRELDGRDA